MDLILLVIVGIFVAGNWAKAYEKIGGMFLMTGEVFSHGLNTDETRIGDWAGEFA